MVVIHGLTDGADSYALNIAEAIKGLFGSDTLTGSADADLIYGNQNVDLIHGGQGDDTLYGGQNDGPAGSDGVLRQGADTLFGDGGNDLIYGNHGADILYSGGGANTVYGGQDADTIYSGSAEYYGDSGHDVLFGNLGDDMIVDLQNSAGIGYSMSGVDVFYGGLGADTIVSGGGSGAGGDTLYGGEGADLFELVNPSSFASQGRVAFYNDVIADFDSATGDRIKLTNLSLTREQLVSLTTEIEKGVYQITFDPMASGYAATGAVIIRTAPSSETPSADWFLT